MLKRVLRHCGHCITSRTNARTRTISRTRADTSFVYGSKEPTGNREYFSMRDQLIYLHKVELIV